MNTTLDQTLRDLDPAVTPEDLAARSDARAQELFARIVATDPIAPKAAEHDPSRQLPRPRTRRTQRLLVMVGGAVAAGTAGALVLPGMLGTDEAMAAWT